MTISNVWVVASHRLLPIHVRKNSKTQLDPPPIGFCHFKRYNNRMQTRHKIVSLSTSVPLALGYEDVIQSSHTLIIQNNNDSGYVYIGGNNVSTSSYGYKMYPGQGFTTELSAYNRIYAVCSTSNMTAAILVIERAI